MNERKKTEPPKKNPKNKTKQKKQKQKNIMLSTVNLT